MRVVTKIGDVFSITIDEKYKKYMQYIANDLTQLNSDVIRAFKAEYSIEEEPNLETVINDNVDFYAHCVLKLGVKMGLWKKVGSNKNIGNISSIIFRDSTDYGHKIGEEPIKVSSNWRVWKIGDHDFKKVVKISGENRNSCIGLVFNPLGIIELFKGNKYPKNYPDYE